MVYTLGIGKKINETFDLLFKFGRGPGRFSNSNLFMDNVIVGTHVFGALLFLLVFGTARHSLPSLSHLIHRLLEEADWGTHLAFDFWQFFDMP